MRRRSRLVFSAVLLAAAAAAADEKAPPEVGVTIEELEGARIVDVVLPGRVGSTVIATSDGHRVSDGYRVVVVAAEDPEGPRILYRVDLEAGSLVELTDLPAEIDGVAHLDLDGDGRLEVIVGEPGKIYSVGLDSGTLGGDGATGHRPRKILEAPGLDLRAVRRGALIHPERALILQPRVGRLEVFRPDAGGIWRAREIDLPIRARREAGGLRLSTPPVHLLALPDGRLLFAVGPERQGKRRLLTTLIDLSGSETGDDGTSAEAWCRLSANERIEQSWVLSVDGSPMLVVATLSGDKLGIFEKKKIRVFPLRADRTRAGAPPSLEIQTPTRNWYDVGVSVTDLDLDGRDDLVVIQPDGLGAKKLVVEVYRGKGNGGFFATPRRSVVVAPQARWTFGDLDGDRVGDLVVLDGAGRLQVFRGLGQSKKKLVVEKKTRWSFAAGLGGATEIVVSVHVGHDGDEDMVVERDLSAPVIGDFDGDGRREILVRTEIGGRALLRFIQLR